jgi:basic membrane protein A and related proteins
MRSARYAVALIGLTVVLAACGGGGQSTGPTGSAAASADNPALSGAALLLTQRRGDKGVIDALVAGFEAGTDRLGYVDQQIVQLEDPATFEQTVRQVAGSGVSIVIATFPPMIDSIKAVAPEFPDVNFVIIDARIGEDMPNVQELFFYENESSYLAGIAAGLMTETDKVGFVGGDDVDVINRYLVGFYEGAHASNENATVCWAYAKSFEDPAKGHEIALSLINDGVDVLHAATAGTQLGIYDAVEETDTFFISADVDVRDLAPTVGLFATGPRFDEAVEIGLEQNANGEFKSGFQQYGMESGLVGATPYSDHVPDDVKAAVDKAAADIAAGTVTVSDDTKLADYSNCS